MLPSALRPLLLLTLLGLPLGAKDAPVLPGLQRDGSVLLPNQWSLRPVGRQVVVGDFPVNLAIHPSGRYVAVLHSGYSQHELRILDLATSQEVSGVALPETYYGLTWSPDGRGLFCSGAVSEVVHAFHFDGGYLSARRDLRLRPDDKTGIPIGVSVSADGRALYVAEGWAHEVTKLSVADGRILWGRKLASSEGPAQNDPEGGRVSYSRHPESVFPYFCVPDDRGHRVYVSLWAAATVLVLDSETGAEIARWKVGEHPTEMCLLPDGRLFVAESNFNTVAVLDVADGHVIERLCAAFEPDAPPGSMPSSLAVDRRHHLLYVANSNNNAVAVFDIASPGRAASLGYIPVGWFPTSVRVTDDGKTLLVANGKGAGSLPNAAGPVPGDTRSRSLQQYIGGLFKGTVSFIDLPSEKDRAARYAAWTAQAVANTPLKAAHRPSVVRPDGNAIPARVGDPSPIQHVIYLVKENRTYDQVLGDMPQGNGAPQLCLFPEQVTPNAHAIAREFVLLDNFFADGEVSADGHEWTVGAQATDFVEKTWPLTYGHNAKRKFEYPGEGGYDFAAPARGYLWDAAARAGVTYRSYGEFAHNTGGPGKETAPSIKILKDHLDLQYRAFDLEYPDVKRAARFISELKRFEAEGVMPRLQIVRLGNDHTMGTRPGARTPTAMVADNDLAFGQIVEAVSHSRFWSTTAIFVLEDDAQNGADHVDAHRIPAYVISAHTRRGVVDSTLYSTTSMIRTIGLILGLQPLSQYDAAAAPMYASFASQPSLAPYTARPALVDLEARNDRTAWGARESARMNLSQADRADDIRLNEIVWRSVKGAGSPMPAPIRAAFFRPHVKVDDD